MNSSVSQPSEMIESHAKAFRQFYEMLVQWNEKMNLTAITDEKEVYVKHFADSLLVCLTSEWQTHIDSSCKVLDMGTGAGFPGIPLAICHANVKFVLCDALQKRVQFLREVVQSLGLQNVMVVHGRAEDLARDGRFRNQFDVVVSRAVARLNVLAELTMPFANIGGHVMSYKGPGVQEELVDGRRAAGQLGGTLERVVEMSLPNESGDRTMVVFQQRQQTPKTFPRKAGTPQKKPL